MAPFSYLLLSRRAEIGRHPAMANITFLQSWRKLGICSETQGNLLIRRPKRLVIFVEPILLTQN